jgi:hypothetical protein
MVSHTERLLRDRDFSFVLCRSIESWSVEHPLFPVWQSVQPAIIDLAKKCLSYDRNGINLYWASDPVQEYRCQNLANLAQMFQHKNPPITNNLLGALEKVITYYFSRRGWKLNVNGEIIIVLLDQVPPESEKIAELMLDTIAKHTKVDMIWVAGRSPTLVSQNLKATTLTYLAIAKSWV